MAGELVRHVAVLVMVDGGPAQTGGRRIVLARTDRSWSAAGLYVIESMIKTLDAQVYAWADTQLLALVAVAQAFAAAR